MPDNQGAAASNDSSADDVKNLKSEFNRKLDNVKDELKRQNDALLAQLQAMGSVAKPAAAEAEPELEDLMYKNPKLYSQKIKDQAVNEVRSELNKQNQETAKLQQVVSSLYSEFPELNHADGELYKLAISKQTAMAKESGNNVATMRAAVAEAALELGMKPKSRRSADEDFTLPASGSSQTSRQPKDGELSKQTKMWAEILGVDESKVKARQQKRRNFTKYE